MLDRQVEVNKKQIKILQNLSLSHAGTVWDGALCLIAFLDKNNQIARNLFEGKRVLELGSGTGILGLAVSTFNPEIVYLTDLPQYLHLIQTNLQKNSKILPLSRIEICPLEWNNFSHIQKISQIDIIIGSELSYDSQCTQKLMKTLLHYKKSNPKLIILISYQKYKKSEINIQIQMREYFENSTIRLVEQDEMDEVIRDETIGIIIVG